jgi:hypothetical protein
LWKDKSSPIYSLVDFLSRRWPPENLTAIEMLQVRHRPRFTCSTTLEALGPAGIRCPPLDQRLMYRYFASLAASGFVAAPQPPAI